MEAGPLCARAPLYAQNQRFALLANQHCATGLRVGENALILGEAYTSKRRLAYGNMSAISVMHTRWAKK